MTDMTPMFVQGYNTHNHKFVGSPIAINPYIEMEKRYGFTYQIEKKAKALPRTFKLSMTGADIVGGYLYTKELAGGLDGLMLRHSAKETVSVFCTAKILGISQASKSLRKTFGTTNKAVKSTIRSLEADKNFLLKQFFGCYMYFSLPFDQFNSIMVRDIFSMKEREIEEFLKEIDFDKEFSEGNLGKLYNNKDEFVQGLRSGILVKEGYDTNFDDCLR